MKVAFRIPREQVRFGTEWYVTGFHMAYQNEMWACKPIETMYKRLAVRSVTTVLNLQDVTGEIYPFDLKTWMGDVGAETVILPHIPFERRDTFSLSSRPSHSFSLPSYRLGVCPQGVNRHEWEVCAKSLAEHLSFDHVVLPWYLSSFGNLFEIVSNMRAKMGYSTVRNWYIEGVHGKVREFIRQCRDYNINLITRLPFTAAEVAHDLEVYEDFSTPILPDVFVDRNQSLAIARSIGKWATETSTPVQTVPRAH